MVFWETAFFYIFALGALLSSIGVVLFRNPLYSAISLIVDFFFFAGLYALLSAHFMAVIQVLVYGGAIMVLFMFIIMLLNLRDDELERPIFRIHYAIGVVACVTFFGFVSSALKPLWNADTIARNRTAAVEKYDADVAAAGSEDDVPAPVIATPSPVPGLHSDLNEPGLQKHYKGRLEAWKSGRTTPAEGKYRPYGDPTFEMPPVLEGKDQRGRPVDVTFGTVEPISILLVNRNVVPFELTAILLLAAIVGAVIIAKKRL